jgi:hypothetical protein
MRIRHSVLVVFALVVVSAKPCFGGETATLRNGFSIHYVNRESLGEVTRLFLSDSKDSFVDVPTDDILEIEQDTTPAVSPEIPPKHGPQAVDLDEALSAASYHNNLSPELVRSVVRAESGFNPNARSVKGAQGLMQLMPQTASQMGVKNPLDPVENLEGGTRYLSELLGRYNNDLPIALAAYNAGPERVQQYHGIPPFPETVAYVNRILRDLYQPTARPGAATKKTTNTTKKPSTRATHAVPVSRSAANAKREAIPATPMVHEVAQGN